MHVAVVTGITGQDGSYMAELLLTKGYRVIGAVRNLSKAATSLPVTLVNQVEMAEWDMLDQKSMNQVLSRYRPMELYNFAG